MARPHTRGNSLLDEPLVKEMIQADLNCLHASALIKEQVAGDEQDEDGNKTNRGLHSRSEAVDNKILAKLLLLGCEFLSRPFRCPGNICRILFHALCQ
jgi:hypothetical protein